MPTLRLDRPRRETLRPWSGSGGSQRCDMSAPVLRTTTQEPTHTPLVHSTCAHPPERCALPWPAADLARWRSGRLAARPRRLRRKSPGGRQFHVPASTRRAQRFDAGGAHGTSGRRAAGDVPASDGRLTGIAGAARCTRQRGRHVGRLVGCRVLGRDAIGDSRSDPPAADRHRIGMVGCPLEAAARRSGQARGGVGGQPATGRRSCQSRLHRRGVDDGDHRVVRRPNGSTALGGCRMARARHRHAPPGRTRRAGDGPGPQRAGRRVPRRRRDGRVARRPGGDVRTHHSSRRGRAGRSGTIAIGAARRAGRRLAVVVGAGRSRRSRPLVH